jgi:Ubiquitin carboxyl-terminal hydrolases
MEDEIEDAKQMLTNEKSKRERWSVENQRRKHNYVPFIFALLQKLAEKG